MSYSRIERELRGLQTYMSKMSASAIRRDIGKIKKFAIDSRFKEQRIIKRSYSEMLYNIDVHEYKDGQSNCICGKSFATHKEVQETHLKLFNKNLQISEPFIKIDKVLVDGNGLVMTVQMVKPVIEVEFKNGFIVRL